MLFLNSEESQCQDVWILKMTVVLTRQQGTCSEGMPVLLVPSESWDVGFCVQSCILLSCNSWEPLLYNWFCIPSLGYFRVKGDVLWPEMWTFRQRTEIILSVFDVEACEWFKLRSVFPAIESSPVTHHLPDFHCWHWHSRTLHGQLGWVIQMKTQDKRHC